MRANGMVLAITGRMGIPNLDSLQAYLLAVDFKLRVYKLVDEHPEAKRDYLYVRQLFDALGSAEANIAEGWRRWIAGEVTQFLRYSLASLEEAKVRLKDGVHRGYFTMEECRETLTIGNRCGAATMALWKSLQPFIKKRPGRRGTVQRSKSPKVQGASRRKPKYPLGQSDDDM
jgi:four helix bundle protein